MKSLEQLTDMVKQHLDRSPIHIIKIKVVQVGGRHLRVSFFIFTRQNMTVYK
ncbi:hypothetical protein RE438_28930 (plasmid) [Bacillus wiedmannii]|uniref:hypothetical protein n=1 Tax=Bacillus wiedmannii TaxID=1890302 RepID=UPI0021D2FB85|nr:hypothetical protein [Bacillus wiedmannii]MCU5577847.1 hypothetical protein [Bacillus wiedmannii]WMS85257.1 hypothetical protein RE438_28930 [Bacillus wiedmannii]HDR7677139.1 hypothetical protein [Bacillus wiedmannii]